MPEISISYSNIPHGKMVTIPNLGVFPNGMRSNVHEKRYNAYQRLHPDWDGSFGDGEATEEAVAVPSTGADTPPVVSESMTKTELLEVAEKLDIEGRSDMTKKELLEAISEVDQ